MRFYIEKTTTEVILYNSNKWESDLDAEESWSAEFYVSYKKIVTMVAHLFSYIFAVLHFLVLHTGD